MSSPNHPTSDIEDAFSSNFPDYIPASPDYVPASPGKTYSSSSNNSFGVVPIVSPTLSFFFDDPLYGRRKWEITLQIALARFWDCYLEQHQNEGNPVRHQEDKRKSMKAIYNASQKELSNIEAPATDSGLHQKLVADSVTATLEAQAANMANTDNTTRPREAHVARQSSYKEFMSYQPINLHCVFPLAQSGTQRCKVKFATGTLTEEALSWWNSFAQPYWDTKKLQEDYWLIQKLLIKKYYPRTEVQRWKSNLPSDCEDLIRIRHYAEKVLGIEKHCVRPTMLPVLR
ncbi:hypothetical protein Tco_0558625 [Tanacetum coccineum]